jgi:SAM-dependent methyltransferase
MKIDCGSGTQKKEGHIGVDIRQFLDKDGKELVDVVLDLGTQPWPWADDSVDEVNASHFLEHLDAKERIHWMNELYRCLKKGGKAFISVPHWASCRAYGDLTHKWPPVSEFFWYYLSKDWRAGNAPHNDFYKCDFDATWFYSMHPHWHTRHQEAQQFALSWYKESCQDTIATLVKK